MDEQTSRPSNIEVDEFPNRKEWVRKYGSDFVNLSLRQIRKLAHGEQYLRRPELFDRLLKLRAQAAELRKEGLERWAVNLRQLPAGAVAESFLRDGHEPPSSEGVV